MQSAAKTPAAYLAELPGDRRQAIDQLRAVIRKVAPKAKESMQYGMLAYSFGEPVFCLASQKQYISLYVDCTGEMLKRYKPRLGNLSCGKSCLRFKSFDSLPLDAIADLLAECVDRHQQGAKP